MFLRQLFEAQGTSIGLVFGRFNPPHKGHRAAWEMASKATYWYVGTNKSTQGPKDPLPYDVKVEAMSTIWPEVADHIMPEQSWLTLASHCFNAHKDATTLICFTDEDWVTKTIQQYNGKKGPHGFYNFKVITQQPTPRLSSATALRDAVVNGDRDAFSQAAGVSANTEVAGHPFFDLVAKYLLPYTNAPKKVSKKKSVQEPAAEGAPELLKKEMPLHRHAEKLLAHNGVSKDDPDYHHHLGNTIKHLRQFGNIDLINKQGVAETEKTLKNSNPCWKGYKPVGTKKKGGRTVPNCVPVSEGVEQIMSILIERLKKK